MRLELDLSDEDLAAIGHVAVDPIAWAQHAFDHVGAKPVRDKIDKYRAEYAAAKAEQGDAYKNRAQRKADEDAALAAKIEAHRVAAEAAKVQRQAEFEAAVAAAVEKLGNSGG